LSFSKILYSFVQEIKILKRMKKDITIGEIVANDYRAAAVFKASGIDF